MTDNMDAMMADGLLRTVRDAAKLLYGENQTYPCDDVKRMMNDVERLRAALREVMDDLTLIAKNNWLPVGLLDDVIYVNARAALEGK